MFYSEVNSEFNERVCVVGKVLVKVDLTQAWLCTMHSQYIPVINHGSEDQHNPYPHFSHTLFILWRCKKERKTQETGSIMFKKHQ